MKKDYAKNLVNTKVNKDRIWKLAMSFQVSKALFIASDLDIFTIVSGNPATCENLAIKLRIHPRPLSKLLNAMTAFGLITKKKGIFSNTELAETFLVKGKPEYFGHYLNAMNQVYRAWDNYEAVIKNNHSYPLFEKKYAEGQKLIDRMMLAQEAFSYRQAVRLPQIFDFSKNKTLLDVGGGTGIFSVMAVKAFPHLKSVIFDIPAMCKIARKQVKHYKTENKIKITAGDFLKDNLPAGADVALLSTILDSYDESECKMILKKVFNSIAVRGTLIVNEMMFDNDKTGPLFPAIFSLELMIERNRGNTRTAGEIKEWMKETGFKKIKTKPLRFKGETYLNCNIVTGEKER